MKKSLIALAAAIALVSAAHIQAGETERSEELQTGLTKILEGSYAAKGLNLTGRTGGLMAGSNIVGESVFHICRISGKIDLIDPLTGEKVTFVCQLVPK